MNSEAERDHALLINTRIHLNIFHRSTDTLAFGFSWFISLLYFKMLRRKQTIRNSECKPSRHLGLIVTDKITFAVAGQLKNKFLVLFGIPLEIVLQIDKLIQGLDNFHSKWFGFEQ